MDSCLSLFIFPVVLDHTYHILNPIHELFLHLKFNFYVEWDALIRKRIYCTIKVDKQQNLPEAIEGVRLCLSKNCAYQLAIEGKREEQEQRQIKPME